MTKTTQDPPTIEVSDTYVSYNVKVTSRFINYKLKSKDVLLYLIWMTHSLEIEWEMKRNNLIEELKPAK